VIGPNCLGIMRPSIGLNATFARGNALPGSLGLVSQSGALCTAMLDWAGPNKIGFSSVISMGGSRDIDFGEIIDYLVNDSKTEHILLTSRACATRGASLPACAPRLTKPI
jgi:acetyltransferase